LISVTDNEATRTLHEAEVDAEAGCYEAEPEAENFGLEDLTSVTVMVC